MNTADRSIALLDTALRRRFGFVELMPDPQVLGDAVVADSIPLGEWLAALNERIREHIGRNARNLQVGHSYLMSGGRPVTDFGTFVRVFGEDILHLLQEYCYEDYAALTRILGSGLVDEARQRIRLELLEPDRRDDFIRALLEPSPELAAAPQVVSRSQEEMRSRRKTKKGRTKVPADEGCSRSTDRVGKAFAGAGLAALGDGPLRRAGGCRGSDPERAARDSGARSGSGDPSVFVGWQGRAGEARDHRASKDGGRSLLASAALRLRPQTVGGEGRGGVWHGTGDVSGSCRAATGLGGRGADSAGAAS